MVQASPRLRCSGWSGDEQLMGGTQLRLMTNHQTCFTKQPPPIFGGVFTMRGKDTEAALTSHIRGFALTFLARVKIGRQGHANPIVQHKEPTGRQHSSNLSED